MYCSGATCWCTDVNKGHEIENTRGPKDSFHCNEQGEKVRFFLNYYLYCGDSGFGSEFSSELYWALADEVKHFIRVTSDKHLIERCIV